jgi:tetratricopeptide (TPR) repeat protein
MRSAGGTLAVALVVVQVGASACITGRAGSHPSLAPASATTASKSGAPPTSPPLPSAQRRDSRATSVESLYPDLQDAVLLADALGTPEAHLRAALEYWKLGIWDAAYGHLSDVITIRPRDSVTLDLRARLMRDLGYLNFAIADANRAVFYAPKSAVARNTLGTVLAGLGDFCAAAQQFQAALALDAEAQFARSNLAAVGDRCRVSEPGRPNP